MSRCSGLYPRTIKTTLPARFGLLHVHGDTVAYSIIGPLQGQGTQLPFFAHLVPAGFPSPAADHLEKHISLDELFEIRAPHVYLVKIEGESMIGAGIYSGDLVIVDRGREAVHGDIVIAALNSEPLCKRLHRAGPQVILMSENKGFPLRYVLEGW
jgi:DNA polymerase V